MLAPLVYSCGSLTPRLMESTPRVSDFQATIKSVESRDPGSPAVLSAQLAYADFLLSGAPGPCLERLEHAQDQLESVDASPKASVMFPDGWARVADLEYRLHLARAACGLETDRANQLRLAAVAARRAVELYRNVFDYRAMVVMQFDASLALHELGESAEALAALEAAIDMDREFGFQTDATNNYKLLLIWSGKPADATQVAALMKDFPKRQTTLKFAWRPSDARITLETRRECLIDGQIAVSRAAADFERHIGTSDGSGWSVAYAHRLRHYEPGVWPTMRGLSAPTVVFPPAPLPAVSFKVSHAGAFEGVTDLEAFAPRLATQTDGLIRDSAPAGGAASLMSKSLEDVVAFLSPGMLEASTAEKYQLETAMWIGATLEQGVWYEISAPLSLPGLPQVVVQNRIQFAFTRMVPCTDGLAQPMCVELVFRATPEQDSLHEALADIGSGLQDPQSLDFAASTEARIVTDPDTLMPYAREERVYWYASIGESAKAKVLQSEHLVSSTRYGAEPSPVTAPWRGPGR
jgi:hypothetical protein